MPSIRCRGSSSPLSDILFAAGWLALLAVAALLYSAITTMRRAKTTMNPNAMPDHLVTSGPFSITRNPMYLGNTLLMIGVGLIAGIAWFLVFAILAAFTTQKVAIEREEKRLTEKFGKRYHDYAKRVQPLDLIGARPKTEPLPATFELCVDAEFGQSLHAGLLSLVQFGERLLQVAALLPQILALFLNAPDHQLQLPDLARRRPCTSE